MKLGPQKALFSAKILAERRLDLSFQANHVPQARIWIKGSCPAARRAVPPADAFTPRRPSVCMTADAGRPAP